MHHTVDAPEPGRTLEPVLHDVTTEVLRHIRALLDDAAVHVHDIERAVGGIREVHRPEALVRGRDEFPSLVRLPRLHRLGVHGQDDAAHDVGGRIRDEGVPVHFRRKTIAAIDDGRADGRELREGTVGTVDACLVRAVGARIRPNGPDDVDCLVAELFVAAARPCQIGIARVVRRRHKVHMQRFFVRIPVDPPGIVVGHAPLAPDQRVADVEPPPLEPEVNVAVGRMDPVVESPVEIVRVFLDATLTTAVPVRHELAAVGMEVAVGVVHQPQVWRLPDQHAVFQHLESPCEHETVGEDGPLVHGAVMIGVFEHHHSADRVHVRFRRDERLDESWHLDDPDAAVDIPVHHHRVLDEGLAGDEFEPVARRQDEGLQRLGWREGRRVERHLLHWRRPGGPRRRLRADARRHGREHERTRNVSTGTHR